MLVVIYLIDRIIDGNAPLANGEAEESAPLS